MTPLRSLAFLFALALTAAASPAAPTGEDAARVVAKIVAAFEKGEPIDAAATKDDLFILETAPVSARAQAALYRRLPDAIKRAAAFQKIRTPVVPTCPEVAAPDKNSNACVTAAARAAAKDLGIEDNSRQEAAASLYLALYLGPKNGTPAELAAAQERARLALSDPNLSTLARARMQSVMKQSGSLKGWSDAGADLSASGVTAGVGGRTVDQALAEARGAGRGKAIKVSQTEVPSLSQRLLDSAAEDEAILKIGADDGTVGTAIGRSVTQAKKTGSQLLSYFVSGETWRRTADGAVSMVTNPGETAHFLPGAIKAGAVSMAHGVKADISNASDEVGNFIENPTPYRGFAVVGSVGLAVSNAFVAGGVRTAARQGAKAELVQGARQAERLSDNLIGAVEHDLDFTTLAAPKPSEYKTATREVRKQIKDGVYVAPENLQGRIGVKPTVYEEVESVGKQRGSDCARFGITSCSIANGSPMVKKDVEEAAAAVMKRESEAEVARLEERARAFKAQGKPTAEVENALVQARTRLAMAEVGLSTEYGLSFDSIGSTLREMKTPHRSLGVDREALAALQRGERPAAVLEYQRKIDKELVQGNAVMAALYTGGDGTHAQHAVTILAKGKDSAGRLVYDIYDSNVGRVAQIPADAVRPFGAVVVGRL